MSEEVLIASIRGELSGFRSAMAEAAALAQRAGGTISQALGQADKSARALTGSTAAVSAALQAETQAGGAASTATAQLAGSTQRATQAAQSFVTTDATVVNGLLATQQAANKVAAAFAQEGTAASRAAQQTTALGTGTAAVGAQSTQVSGILAGLIARVGAAAAAYLTLRTALNIGESIVTQTVQMQALAAAYRGITGSTAAAGEQMGFVRQQAQRLGFDTLVLADSYKGLLAASQHTNLEGQKTQDIFLAIAEAGRVFQLSNEQIGGALVAVQQIMSKGVVSAEELRGQLGERLPGAFNIAARALGVTTAELGKMLEAGTLLSTDFIPKFSAQIQQELGGAVAEASQTAAANFARFGNAMRDLAVALGESGLVTWLSKAAAGIAAVVQEAVRGSAALEQFKKDQAALQAATGGQPNVRTAEITELQQRIFLRKQELDILTSGTYQTRADDVAGQEKIRILREELTLIQAQEKTLMALVPAGRIGPQQEPAAPAIPLSFAPPRAQGLATTEGVEAYNIQLRKVVETQRQLTAQAADSARILGQPFGPAEQLAVQKQRVEAYQKALEAVPPAERKLLAPDVLATLRAGGVQVQTLTQTVKDLRTAGGANPLTGIQDAMQDVKRLQDFLAHPPPGTAEGALVLAQRQLDALLQKQLPDALQAFAKTSAEYRALQAALSQTTDPQQLLILQRQLEELATNQLPAALQGTAQMRDALADLQRIVDAAHAGKLPLDAEQVAQLEGKLQEATAAYQAFTVALEHRVTPQQFVAFQGKNDEAERQAQERVDALRQEAQFQHELALATATSLAERQAAETAFDAVKERFAANDAERRDIAHNGELRARADARALEATQREQSFALQRIQAQFADEQHMADPFQRLLGSVHTYRENQQRAFAEYIAWVRTTAGGEQRAQELIGQETQRRLEEASRDYQRFAEQTQAQLSGMFEQVFQGDFQGVLDDSKRAFIKWLADLAAAALTQKIIVPLQTLINGQPGTGATGTGANIGQIAQTTTSSGQSWFQVLGGGSAPYQPAAGTISLGGTTGALQGPTPSGATLDTVSGSLSGGGGMGGGLTGGIQAGIAVQQLSAQGFESLGVRGKANTAASGAIGGAVGGAMIGNQFGGPYGAIIGAVIGLVVGGITGALLGKEYKPKVIDINTFELPVFMAGPGGVRAQSGAEGPLTPVAPEFAQINADEEKTYRAAIRAAGETVFGSITQQVQQLPERFQTGIVDKLNEMTGELSGRIDDFRADGKDIVSSLNDFLTHDIPREVEDIFGTFLRAVQVVAPVARDFELAIDALRERQHQLLANITQARQGLTEALFTPAQVFEARQATLQQLLTQFDTGTGAEQLQLAPQITALAQEIFGLAKNNDVLGTDLGALKALQEELLSILDDVETATTARFTDQIAIAQKQLEVLQASLTRLEGVEAAVQASKDVLVTLQDFFETAFAGSFAAGGTVEKTGLGLLHAGERIVPAPGHRMPETQTAPRDATPPVPVGMVATYPFVGSFATGGLVPQTGLALVHAGETVTARATVRPIEGRSPHRGAAVAPTPTAAPSIQITFARGAIDTGGAPIDEAALADRLSTRIAAKMRLEQGPLHPRR